MQKQASIAVSALISILSVTSPAVAIDGGRAADGHSPSSRRALALAQTPGVMPAPAVVPGRVGAARTRNTKSSASRPNYIRLATGSYPVNHLQRGLFLRQQGNTDAALVEFLKAAQENPAQVRAFYEQALIFKQKGYNKLAQSALQQALTVKPDFHDARVLLASLYLQDGDLSHATKELFTSLGLDLDKGFGAQKMPQPTPLRQPTIVQTPHGRLPMPAAPSVVPQSIKDLVGVRTETAAPQSPSADAFNQNNEPQTSPRQNTANQPLNPGGPVHQGNAGSFSIRELSTEQANDEEFLKKILGMNPPVSSITTTTTTTTTTGHAEPVAPGSPPSSSITGADDHPTPDGAAKVIQASDTQAQQLLKQLKGGPRKNEGFNWFNPFSWFDKHQLAAASPPAKIAPPLAGKDSINKAQKVAERQLAAQKKADEQARKKSEEQARKQSEQMAKLQAEEKRLESLSNSTEEEGGNDKEFNPVKTVSAKPTEEVHPPARPNLLKKALSWLPGFKEPDKNDNDRYSLPLAPAIGETPPAKVPPVEAPLPGIPPPPATNQLEPPPPATNQLEPPPSNNTAALQSVLKMLPKDIAKNLEKVLLPKDANTAAGEQTSIAGINKNVFDNLVSARVSSSSMPEAVNPAEQPVVPAAPQAVPADAAPPVSAGGSPLVQTGTPRVEETTLEAQVARAGIYIPPQLRALPPRAGRLAAQGFLFVAPALTNPQQYAIRSARSAAATRKQPAQPAPPEDPTADAWTKRMRYLLTNGTSSLAPGEAFMFSEETGEGVFFMPDGSSIRRKVAKPMGHEAVVQLRRPDIYNDKGELQYNLAVMGKVIVPKKPEETAPVQRVPGHFDNDPSVKEMLNSSQGFLGWLKTVFSF